MRSVRLEPTKKGERGKLVTERFATTGRQDNQRPLVVEQRPDCLFLQAAKVATKPFIYLSAGVSNAEFTESLELAAGSGVKFNGVLCGRATWKDGIPIYAKQGAEAFRKWLETEGVKNINNVNSKLKAATSWHSIYEVEPAMASV